MIEVHSSFIKVCNIKNLEAYDTAKLVSSLTLRDKFTFQPYWQALRFEENRNGTLNMILPRNVLIPWIKKIFFDKHVVEVDPLTFINTLNLEISDAADLLKKQYAPYNFLLNTRANQKMVVLPTDFGKTFFVAYYLMTQEKKAYFILHKQVLFDQWIENFEKISPNLIRKKDFKIIKSSADLKKLAEAPHKTAKFFILTHKLCTDYAKRDSKEFERVLRSFENIQRINSKVFDEAHLRYQAIFEVDSRSEIEETIYLTATPKRTDQWEERLFKNIIPVKDAFGVEIETSSSGKRETKTTIAKDKIVTTIRLSVDTSPDYESIRMTTTLYGFSATGYFQNLQEPKTLKYITDSILNNVINVYREKYANIRSVILVKTLDFAKDLETYITTNTNYTVGQYNGLTKHKALPEQFDRDIVISTDKMFQEGNDRRDFEILINLIPMRSDVNTEQLIGRLRQDNENTSKKSIYVDIIDTGYKTLISMAKSRKKVIEKLSKKIYEIE